MRERLLASEIGGRMPFALHPYTPRSPQLTSDCLTAVPELEFHYHSSISVEAMMIYWLGIWKVVIVLVVNNSHQLGFLSLRQSFS